MPAGTETSDDTTVLVADDDPGVRALVTVLLRRAGYETIEAATGREAYDTVRRAGDDLDVVLLDVMMPEMNGDDALRAIRSTYPELPVIFFSGFDRNEVADHLADAAGYTSFLPKPFENTELLEEIERAVDKRR